MKKFFNFLAMSILIMSCDKTKIIRTSGTTFGHDGGRNECIVDDTKVSCFKMRKEFRKYKRNIKKCNPCWLVQKDYNGKLVAEGYAMKISNFNHHHYWFAELIFYNAKGDTISHQIDSNYNMDSLLKLPRRKILNEIRNRGNSLTW